METELDRVRVLVRTREIEAVMDAASHAEAKARLEAKVEWLQEVRWPAWKCPRHPCTGSHPGTPTRLPSTVFAGALARLEMLSLVP